jgi:methionine aminopeptidase
MDADEKRIIRSMASSMQESAQAMVQINNRLAEIGRELKELNNTLDNQPASAESPL